MHHTLKLPRALAGRPFTVSEAAAVGMTKGELRSPTLRTPFRGVRVPAALPDTLAVRCLAASLILPRQAVFDGATAASLRGLPLPRRLDPGAPITVRVPPGTTRPQIEGVRVSVGRVQLSGPVRPGTLRVAAGAHVWAQMASHPRIVLDDLVILGDAVARQRNGLAALRAAAAASTGRRGVQAMRGALVLVREHVDSPQETRTRLLLVRAGVPEPECGQDVFGDDGLTWLARPDLRWLEAKVALEYDGETHRTDRKQWRDDLSRKELMDDHGWIVIVVTADDLRYRRSTIVRRVERRLRERGMCW